MKCCYGGGSVVRGLLIDSLSEIRSRGPKNQPISPCRRHQALRFLAILEDQRGNSSEVGAETLPIIIHVDLARRRCPQLFGSNYHANDIAGAQKIDKDRLFRFVLSLSGFVRVAYVLAHAPL